MASRKPLVVGADGLPQQLQPGDNLDAPISQTSVRQAQNANAAGAMVFGTPVYLSAADAVKSAQANAKATAGVAALVQEANIAVGGTGTVATDGILVGTTAQWDAVTGQVGGLTPGSLYFLDAATAGKLTAVAPSAVGQCNTKIGRALSTTEMDLDIRDPILL